MTERHYHFTIPQSNVFDYVTAVSFLDAKAKAFDEYGPWWNLIEWLDPDDVPSAGIEPMDDLAS
jgi:hypothetical protein